MATRRCFSNFVRHLSSHGRLLEGIEKYLGTFRRLVETSVKVCKTATEMALSVFANHEKPLGMYCSNSIIVFSYDLQYGYSYLESHSGAFKVIHPAFWNNGFTVYRTG